MERMTALSKRQSTRAIRQTITVPKQTIRHVVNVMYMVKYILEIHSLNTNDPAYVFSVDVNATAPGIVHTSSAMGIVKKPMADHRNLSALTALSRDQFTSLIQIFSLHKAVTDLHASATVTAHGTAQHIIQLIFVKLAVQTLVHVDDVTLEEAHIRLIQNLFCETAVHNPLVGVTATEAGTVQQKIQ